MLLIEIYEDLVFRNRNVALTIELGKFNFDNLNNFVKFYDITLEYVGFCFEKIFCLVNLIAGYLYC